MVPNHFLYNTDPRFVIGIAANNVSFFPYRNKDEQSFDACVVVLRDGANTMDSR